ncbi:MAG: hypothetical protein C0410_02005 [Anaerolinea sp.]|nr:hypothetical protein [Anaerolinea sp.]
MNKVLKWVLIGLGIAVVVFGIAMVAFRGFVGRPELMMGGRVLGFHRPFSGMMFGMGLFMLFRVLLGGTVLGLAVFGLIALFRPHKSLQANAAVPTVPVVPETQAEVEPQRICLKCSQPLQPDWKNCPYCGKKQ